MQSHQAIPNQWEIPIFAALAPEKARQHLQHLPRGKGHWAVGCQGEVEEPWCVGRAVLGWLIADAVTAVRPQVFHHLMQGTFLIKVWSCDVPASLIQSLE